MAAVVDFDHADARPIVMEFRFTFPGDAIDRLTQSFAVSVQPEGATISHGLATALIGADGSVMKIWRGNAWQPAEVIAELRKL